MNSKRSSPMLYIILVICLIVTMSILAHFYVKDKQRDKEYRMITQTATNHIDVDTNQGNVINEQDNIINEHGLFHNSNVEPPYLSNSVQPHRSTFIFNQSQPSRPPQEQNALDRVYNPLRYPYKSRPYYNQGWYPNLMLPPQVVGCGARNTPCMGGTQIPIPNPMSPINISDNNIAPINMSTRGPLGQPQQVGAIYKILGNENQVYPLYGRKKYPNGDKWEYYTTIGQYGVKMPIIRRNTHDELGTNDLVFIQGQRRAPYRVTMYENDSPEYIPYI